MTVQRKLVYAVIVVTAVVALMEGGARLLEKYVFSTGPSSAGQRGWQTEFFGRFFEWHESDPDLLWRFKAGLNNRLITTNSDHFLGGEIARPKPPRAYRVFILGDSSPVGLGLDSRKQTFGELLRFLLEKHHAGRKEVEVVNAAVSGYSSEQVRRLLETKIWDYDPDLVIVYCGNNDASLSGVSSDRELMAAQRFKPIRTICLHLALYRLMCSLVKPSSARHGLETGELKVRVSSERYGENLKAIIGQCQKNACPVIILKPPVPYLWPAGLQFKPFRHLTGEDGQVIMPERMASHLGREIAYCISEQKFDDLCTEGDIFVREVYRSVAILSDNPQDAIKLYAAQAEANPADPVAANNYGVACWQMEQYEKAAVQFDRARHLFQEKYRDLTSPTITAAYSPFLYNTGINLLCADSTSGIFPVDTTSAAFACLDSALQADYFSLRIKKIYSEKIDELAYPSKIAIIDLPKIFAENGGEIFFIDHCHPTPEGHLLIAQSIFRTITDRKW